MLSKKVKSVFTKVSYRLAFVYLLFLIPCFIASYLSLNYLTEDYLEKRDRDVLEVRQQFYQNILEDEGLAGFKDIFSDPTINSQASRFLIYIVNPEGQIIFRHLSEDSQLYDLKKLETQLSSLQNSSENLWQEAPSKNGEEGSIEYKVVKVHNSNNKLIVGYSTDERDDLLEKIRNIFFTIMISFLVFATIGVIMIAQKILFPLKNLNDSIAEIKSGKLSSRVPLTTDPLYKDELYELSLVFNQMIDQIELLVKILNETVDNIAHDLKTPISRVRMTAEIALMSNSQKELKLAAEETIENCDNILALIQTILKMARYDSKTVKLHKTLFNIKDLYSEIVELYFFVAEQKSITLEIRTKEFSILADRLIIKQTIANLLDNALKYSDEKTTIILSAEEFPKEYKLSIEDKGHGISPDDIDKIWERLYRGDKSRHEPGMGLGLSLVKVFVEAHEGTINVSSELGKGTKFIISIPKV